MKKKIITILTALTLTVMCNGSNIKATEDYPAYLITDDYIIIDHEKYDLINNKINYKGLEYELKESVLISTNDGVETVFILPVEENKITDEETIKELNRKAEIAENNARALPSNTQNLPYYAYVPKGQWNLQTPIMNINIPGFLEIPLVKLSITDMSITAEKRFSISYVTGTLGGDWFTQPFLNDVSFRFINFRLYQTTTATRYAFWTVGSLYDNTGYTLSLTAA